MGRIFAIKKYAIHDGPNLRTTVFFKGCPLRCGWCHNPEGIDHDIRMLWKAELCCGCGQCPDACPNNALTLQEKGIARESSACTGCSRCRDACPALAHEPTGQQVEAETIMEEIKKDLPFYDGSGGGVTFSGGDPLAQPDFLLELLRACKALGIHRAVDTCAHTKSPLLDEIAGLTDLFLLDIKQMDSALHKKFTGLPNELILSNIKRLARMGKKIRFRIPLIQGVNCDQENIGKTGAFIAETAPDSQVDLLPFHGMAASKYKKLGRPLSSHPFKRPDSGTIDRCTSQLEAFRLKVTLGG